MEVRISVRNLVEFILRSGDIDNRRAGGADNAMQEGSRLHRVLQARMGGDYAAEVYLRFCFDTKDYQIIVDGRADGIFTDDAGITVIDEIKTTYKELFRVKEPNPVHLAQAKVYAAIYGLQNNKKIIRIRMTYCNVETEDVRYFFEEYTMDELQNWFQELLLQYKKWADYEFEWNLERQASIENLQFPFPYREGQRDLVSNVYRTIYHKRKLFIEAPTGVGKTISTVFPAVKAMGKNMGAKIFYLTAKTITRTVAEDTFQLLRNAGLSFKSVTITAKEKICFMENVECNPDACPYAKGHLDRINDAVYDLLTHESSFEREIIEEYARKHQVCPFEFCLDVSLFADGIICDYNYVFDPHVYLKRFFAEGNQEDYIFLVDEAHNLLDRGREMYSAELIKERFLEVKRGIAETIKGMKGPVPDKARIRDFGPKMERRLDKCNKEMLILKKECEEHNILTSISPLVQAVDRLHDTMNEYLEENDDNPARKDILDFYFELSHFLLIYDLMDDGYVTYSELQEDGSFKVKLFCVDPANNLKECMERSRSTILFSATFLPIQYYKKLLGGEAEDYEVYAHSIFEPEKRALYICDDVTSKYTRRNESEYLKIAGCIHNIVKNRHGNYMVFFPSHAFLMEVYECYQDYFAGEDVECVIQEEFMNEKKREEFLERFSSQPPDFSSIHMDIEMDFTESADSEDRILIGFCVLGGIFSEGIDLKRDSLIGAIIVGTGLPQVCFEREILKNYFDEREENGFDYAYRFPGMNKVLQAAGRVIRTADDVGIIALLDERFVHNSYKRLFPKEWENYEVVRSENISKKIEKFWDSWL